MVRRIDKVDRHFESGGSVDLRGMLFPEGLRVEGRDEDGVDLLPREANRDPFSFVCAEWIGISYIMNHIRG